MKKHRIEKSRPPIEKARPPVERSAPPALTFPAVRCPACGAEMFVRSSRVMDVRLFDPASGKTYAQRRQRFYECPQCGGHRLANAPVGDALD